MEEEPQKGAVMKFIGCLFSFAKRVVKSAFKAIGEFVSSLAKNLAGVTLLAGAAIGFTTLATQLPFQVAMPLWIESVMVAPLLGVFCVFILVHLMKLQLAMQGA